MGTKIDDIVKVTITAQTQPPSKDSYSIILIAGKNWTFTPERFKLYGTDDLAAVAADLTLGTTDPEYLAASSIASQSPRPTMFAAGSVTESDNGENAFVAALNNIVLENPNFYGIICASRVQADQQAVAEWVQANRRVAIFASAGNLTETTNDLLDEAEGADDSSLAAYLKDNTINRAMCIYHADAATDYVDAGALAVALVKRPGTYTLCHKQVLSSSIDSLTTTQAFNVHAKYATTYENVGERNILFETRVGDGKFLDLIIWLDWLETQIKKNEYGLLVSVDKLSYTDGGIGQVQSVLDKVLKLEQALEAITPYATNETTKEQIGGYNITVPKLQDIPQVDISNRILKNVRFKAWYNNSIQTMEIAGLVIA
jgi:hypothetical protein